MIVDFRLRRHVVKSATPEGGGYQVSFGDCGHAAFFIVHPGRTAHCPVCMDELVADIRSGKVEQSLTPKEFLVQ